MRLSIITINLNNIAGLTRTIDSIFHQEFADFEYIVIDGGSTDGSVDLIVDYSRKFSKKFNWLSEKDYGIFNAMNKGINLSKGQYLLFLNSGDYLANNSALIKLFDSDFFLFDFIIAQCAITSNDNVIYLTQPFKSITLGSLIKSSLPHQATLIRREVFEIHGLYREDLKIMSDWEFNIRCLILNNCSYKFVEFHLSYYPTDGISSKPENFELIKSEKEMILSTPPLNRVAPDYYEWFEVNETLTPFLWLNRKKIFKKIIEIIYKSALALQKNKKSL
jgi:glycosyltransferase involved in cell wall biosynthesis